MGYVSNHSRGYSHGFGDGFLNHLKSFRHSKFNSIFSLIFTKTTPESEYVDGYESGYQHGKNAREKFIIYAGSPPTSTSDFYWLNKEQERATLIDYFNSDSEQSKLTLAELNKIYLHLKSEIEANYIYRALKDGKQFFHDSKNYFGYYYCNILLDRLEANRVSKANGKISKEEGENEFTQIRNGILLLVESEIKSTIDSLEKSKMAKTDKYSLKSSSDFALANSETIERIIVNNWKVPKTNIPGQYAELFNRIIKWFDNFKPSELEYALMILLNLKYYSHSEIDELLNKMSGELNNLFKGDFSTVSFFGLGNSAGESGNQFLYSLKQKLNLTGINFPKDFNNLHPTIKSIVFIDDIIGTGKQATDFSKTFLSNFTINKYYYSLMAFESGLKRVKESSSFTDVFTTKVLRESEKAFSDSSELFPDAEIRNNIKSIASSYGSILYPKGPLGYDDSQALIVFTHNTPNNTLPIIWASEKNEKIIGVPWNPIWERRKVVKPKNID